MKKLAIILTALLLLTACTSNKYEKLMEEGEDHLENERYDEAIISFKKALKEKDAEEAYLLLEETIKEKESKLNKEKNGLLNNDKESDSNIAEEENVSQKPSTQNKNQNESQAGNRGTKTPKQEETFTEDLAEQLVKKHLGIQEESGISVTFDHFADNGDYIVHVYEFILDNSDTNEGHTATIGWYGVNPKTKAVYDAMDS